MLEDIKNTIKHSAIYGFSRISIKFIAFILFPLYSVYFSVEQYGVIVRAEIFWQLLQSFLLYAVETAIIRWYTLLPNDSEKKSLIFSVFSFLLVINIIILFLTLFFVSDISNLLFNSNAYSEIVILCILISLFETLIGLPLVILRIKEKALKYSSIVTIETVFSLILQIYFITKTNYGIAGIFYSKLAASFLTFLILLPTLLKTINLKLNIKLFSDVIKFSYPLMTASLVSALFNNIDRYILGYLTESEQVGLYGLGNNIAGILTFLFISPFALAFPPIFWKKIQDDNSARYFTKSMTYSYFVFIYGALVLSLITPFFIKIFALNPNYWAARDIVPFISFSLVLYGMQVVGFMSFYYHKKTSIVLIILSISLVLKVVLNLLLIPHFKMYGSAIAAIISFAVSVLLIYKLSKKYYFIKWENYKLAISMLIAILLVLPFYLIKIENLTLTIALSLIAIIIYPFILYLLKFYEEIELQTMKKFVLKYLMR